MLHFNYLADGNPKHKRKTITTNEKFLSKILI